MWNKATNTFGCELGYFKQILSVLNHKFLNYLIFFQWSFYYPKTLENFNYSFWVKYGQKLLVNLNHGTE